ncbi:dispersed gene family protein 1 (DGF-1), putative, partial [Trypanosoma cruzi marinkellei]
MDGTVA